MNIKMINLVQILEGKTCINPINGNMNVEYCPDVNCNECPANIHQRYNDNDIRLRAVRGIINEQGVE